MDKRPTLKTKRLILRPFHMDDASDVRKHAGEKEIAAFTLNIPHPYEEGMAEEWIGTHVQRFKKRESATFAITLKSNQELIGAIGLELNNTHRRAELGYWIAKGQWNQGYCSEAARAVLTYGFEVLGLQRIFAHHMSNNPASGQVMRNIGMRHEGTLRKHVLKWERFVDLEMYSILKDEYDNQKHGNDKFDQK